MVNIIERDLTDPAEDGLDMLADAGLIPFAMSGHTNLTDPARARDFRDNIRLASFFGCEYIVSSIGEAHLADRHAAGAEDTARCISAFLPELEARDRTLVLEVHGKEHGTGRILPVFEGDTIELGGRTLEIIHLPGHTPGSVTVFDRNNRCLIGGDSIQEDGNIYMFGQHRDMDAYIAGLERLSERGGFDWIYPSHAKEKVSCDVIPQLIEGAKRILAGQIPGEEIEVHGKKVASCDVGISRFLCEPTFISR